MRTTVRLDEALLSEAKQLAARSGRTLTSIVEEALRRLLAERTPEPRAPVKLTTFKGNGLRPGVDLDDSASVLDLMEGGRDADA
jgi:hypothetical protein